MRIKFIVLMLIALVITSSLPTKSAAANIQEKLISNFENGSENWHGDHHFAGGADSQTSLRLSNPANESVSMYKDFNLALLQGYTHLELDLRLKYGNLLPGDASALAIEQGGWKWVSLANYVQSDNFDWQHLSIPLSDFSGLNPDEGIVRIIFRFWNNPVVNHYIDNIKLTTNTEQPLQLSGHAASSTQINLSWQGNYGQYSIYLDDQKIACTDQKNYQLTQLTPATAYTIYITGVKDSQESNPSNSLTLTTPASEPDQMIISDFEEGHPQGWRGIVNMNSGNNSNFSIRVSNPSWGSADAYKDLKDEKIAQEYTHLELDINLQGAYLLPNDASALYFEQGGWKMISLASYVQNGQDGWQHLSIPLSDFGLNNQEGISRMGFRFWNYQTNLHLIDNIVLANK